MDNMSGGKDFYLYDHNAGRFNTVSQEEFFANARWAVSTYYNLNFISQEQDDPAMKKAFGTPGTRGVWIDEFDTVALNLTEKCVISGETDTEAARELDVMRKLHELMAAGRMSELEDKGALTIRKARDRQKQVTLTGFPVIGGKAMFKKIVASIKAGSPELANVPFDTWVRMMEALYTAKYSWEIGRDYEIRDGDVVSRDAQTDLLMFGREMADISDALRLLNGIEPKGKKQTISERPISEFLTLASFSDGDVYNIGGTSATGARTVEQLYRGGEGLLPEIKVINEDMVGRDFKDNRGEAPVIASADEADARGKLIVELRANLDTGQIIKVKVEDAETIAGLIREEMPDAVVQILAGDINSATKETYVNNAGKRGVITIIDNANVRGTSPRVDEENGNWEKGIVLHLLYPEDFDIEEEQLVGRIARAGEPGEVKRHYNVSYFEALRDRQEGKEAKAAINDIIAALRSYQADQGEANASRLSKAIERYKDIRFADRIARDMRELDPEKVLQSFRGTLAELSSDESVKAAVETAFDSMMSDPDVRAYYGMNVDRIFNASRAAEDNAREGLIRSALGETFNITPDRFGEENVRTLAAALSASADADAFKAILSSFVKASAVVIASETARRERTDFLTKKEMMRREMNALSALSGAVGTPLEAQRDSLAIKLGENAVQGVKAAPGNAVFMVLFGKAEQQEKAADRAASLRAKENIFKAVLFALKGAVILGLIYIVNNRLGLGNILKAQVEGGIGRNEIIAGLNNIFPFLGGEYVSVMIIAAFVILLGVMAFSKTYLKRATAHPKPVEDMIKLMDGTYRGNKARAVGSFVLYQFVLSLVGFLATATAGALAVTGVIVMVTTPASAMASLSGVYASAIFAGLIAAAAKALTYYLYSSKKELSPEDLSRGYSWLDTGALVTGLVAVLGTVGSAYLMRVSPVAGSIGVLVLAVTLLVSRVISRKFHGDARTLDKRALAGYGLAVLIAAPAIALVMYSGGAWLLSGAFMQIAAIPFMLKVALTMFSSIKLSSKMAGIENRLMEKPRIIGFMESIMKISIVSFIIIFAGWTMATTTIPGMIWGKHALSATTWFVSLGIAAMVVIAVMVFFRAAASSRGRSSGLLNAILDNATAQQGLALMGVGSAISIMGPQVVQETMPVQMHAQMMDRVRTLNQQDLKQVAAGLSQETLAGLVSQPAVTTSADLMGLTGATTGSTGIFDGTTGSGPGAGGTPPVVLRSETPAAMSPELQTGLDRINAIMTEATRPGTRPQDASDKLVEAARILRELAPEHPEVLYLMGENTRGLLSASLGASVEKPADLAAGLAEIETLMAEINRPWSDPAEVSARIARVSDILRKLAPKYPNIFELFGEGTRNAISDRIFPDMAKPLSQQPAELAEGIKKIDDMLQGIADKRLGPAAARGILEEASRELRQLATKYPAAMSLLKDSPRSMLTVQLVAVESPVAAATAPTATTRPAVKPAAPVVTRPALAEGYLDNIAGMITAKDISEMIERATGTVKQAVDRRDKARKELEAGAATLDENAQLALKDRIDEAEMVIQSNNAYIVYFTELGKIIGRFEAPVRNARKAYDELVARNADEQSRVDALLALLRLKKARVDELAKVVAASMSSDASEMAKDILSLGETTWHEGTRTNIPVITADAALDDAAMAQVRMAVVLDREGNTLGAQIEGLEAIPSVREKFAKIEALVPRIEHALDMNNDEEAAPLIREMMVLVGDLGSRGMKTMEPINMGSLTALDRIMMRFISLRQEMIASGIMKLNAKDARKAEIDQQLADLRLAVFNFRRDVSAFKNEGEYRLALLNLQKRMECFTSGLTQAEKDEMSISEQVKMLEQVLQQAQRLIEMGFDLQVATDNAGRMQESMDEIERRTAAARAQSEVVRMGIEVLTENVPATATYTDDKETYEVMLDGYAFIRMDGRRMVEGALDGERAWHDQAYGLLERRDLIYSVTPDMKDMVNTSTLTEENGRQTVVTWLSAEPQGDGKVSVRWRETYLDRGKQVSRDHAYTYQVVPINRNAGNMVLRMTQGNKKDVMNYRMVTDEVSAMRLIRRGYRFYDRQGAPVYSDKVVDLARHKKYQEALIQHRMDTTAAQHADIRARKVNSEQDVIRLLLTSPLARQEDMEIEKAWAELLKQMSPDMKAEFGISGTVSTLGGPSASVWIGFTKVIDPRAEAFRQQAWFKHYMVINRIKGQQSRRV
ncbi:MAG: hypothetical protein PHH49_08470, partial [Candidatus Omnitrophica bacterium]|nr:hypothetical protein [Candidatus Omnitrophota bacterium]